jgi:hypothetical protein
MYLDEFEQHWLEPEQREDIGKRIQDLGPYERLNIPLQQSPNRAGSNSDGGDEQPLSKFMSRNHLVPQSMEQRLNRVELWKRRVNQDGVNPHQSDLLDSSGHPRVSSFPQQLQEERTGSNLGGENNSPLQRFEGVLISSMKLVGVSTSGRGYMKPAQRKSREEKRSGER